jgi:hypothetical protein
MAMILREDIMNPASRIPDFNVMVALHQHDPEAFEHFRRHLLREAVEEAPAIHRPALEQLLERMETVRDEAGSPAEAAAAAFGLMQESVGKLRGAWEEAEYAVAGLQTSLLLERLRTGA